MNSRLLQHYEKKYAHEIAGSDRAVVFKYAPRDRFEACVHYMHSHFKDGDILEVGGGDGTIARSLRGLLFETYTITDLSPTRANAAAASLNDPRFRGFALDVESGLEQLPERRFSTIIMTALIEHLIDPLGAMKRLGGLLSEKGFIYIDTPNIAKFTRRIKLLLGNFPSTASMDEGLITYDGKPVDLHDEGHLHYFTFRSLSEMLKRHCGFSSVDKTPYWAGPSPFPPRMSFALAKAWPEMFSEVAIIARR